MADFNDLIGKLKEPGEDGVPDSIYDDLTSEYTNIITGSEAKLADKDKEIAALKGENTALKTKNYDLLVAVGDSSGTTTEATPENKNEPTIDSLFIKKGS